MIIDKCYPVVIQKGDDVICEISVGFNKGVTTYAIMTRQCTFRVISEEKFKKIISHARRKGYYIFDYGTFE